MKPIEIPANDIGLTKYHSWDDSSNSKPLEDQLQNANWAYDKAEVPHLVGMADCARLVFFTSKLTGKHVVVFVIPHRYEIDAWGEEYFYFEGMSREKAMEDENWWLAAYDRCRQLRDAVLQR